MLALVHHDRFRLLRQVQGRSSLSRGQLMTDEVLASRGMDVGDRCKMCNGQGHVNTETAAAGH